MSGSRSAAPTTRPFARLPPDPATPSIAAARSLPLSLSRGPGCIPLMASHAPCRGFSFSSSYVKIISYCFLEVK
ncbi:hypothetical protein VPH35_010653 [Triticum aestivum]